MHLCSGALMHFLSGVDNMAVMMRVFVGKCHGGLQLLLAYEMAVRIDIQPGQNRCYLLW
jgi:hypothetical protein